MSERPPNSNATLALKLSTSICMTAFIAGEGVSLANSPYALPTILIGFGFINIQMLLRSSTFLEKTSYFLAASLLFVCLPMIDWVSKSDTLINTNKLEINLVSLLICFSGIFANLPMSCGWLKSAREQCLLKSKVSDESMLVEKQPSTPVNTLSALTISCMAAFLWGVGLAFEGILETLPAILLGYALINIQLASLALTMNQSKLEKISYTFGATFLLLPLFVVDWFKPEDALVSETAAPINLLGTSVHIAGGFATLPMFVETIFSKPEAQNEGNSEVLNP